MNSLLWNRSGVVGELCLKFWQIWVRRTLVHHFTSNGVYISVIVECILAEMEGTTQLSLFWNKNNLHMGKHGWKQQTELMLNEKVLLHTMIFYQLRCMWQYRCIFGLTRLQQAITCVIFVFVVLIVYSLYIFMLLTWWFHNKLCEPPYIFGQAPFSRTALYFRTEGVIERARRNM